MKRVLITGANSYIGTSVETWLNKYSDQFHVDTVDTINDAWKQVDFSQYDVVYHVAGIAHVKAKKSQEELYYTVNRDLTIDVAKTAKTSGVKQFIFMSSVIVYGESKSLKPVIITKDTLPSPNGFYGDSKLQAEKGLQELNDDSFKVVILRPPMIYGPESKGNFPRLIKLARVLPVFPAFHNKRSMLYIDNLCEFVRLVILQEEKGVFFPQNSEYSDTSELVKQLATLQGKKIHLVKWLVPFVHVFSPFINSINKLFGSLVYDTQLSDKSEYAIVSQAESLKRVVEI
ncbi:MAG: NAD-dependent epimerase/dehydratase family protein [Sphaerochaeta sp.]|nr:NAD-dependent epimerase/dehydratase family protein [Sphaerochaeta sp.]